MKEVVVKFRLFFCCLIYELSSHHPGYFKIHMCIFAIQRDYADHLFF